MLEIDEGAITRLGLTSNVLNHKLAESGKAGQASLLQMQRICSAFETALLFFPPLFEAEEINLFYFYF